MNKLFLKIYDTLSSRKPLSAVILILLITVCAILATHIHYEEDISKFLPQNEQNEKNQEVYQQIAMQNRIALLFTAKDTTATVPIDSMEEAMEAMGTLLTDRKEIRNLQVSVDETGVIDLMQFVCQNYPYFLLPSDYRRIDSLLSRTEYIAEQLEENKRMMMLPAADAMQTLRYDPLHLFSPVLTRMQSFRAASQFQIIDSYLFSADGRLSMITFESPYGSNETRNNGEIAQLIDEAIAKTEAQYTSLRISAIGAPLIAVTNANRIKSDSTMAIAIASLLILILLWLHYRRLSDMLWIVASIGFGWLFAIAVLSLFKESISIIVLGIDSVIIGIAVNYPLHFLDHIREVPDRRAALKEMVPPLLIGNITTVAAFLCLVWLDAQAMRDLGLFGSLMLVGTILFVLIFLPLYARQPRTRLASNERSEIRWSTLLSTRHHRKGILLSVVAITLVLGYFSLHTSFDSDLSHINYMTPSQRTDLKVLSALSNDAPVYAVAEGRSLEEAAEANHALQTALEHSAISYDTRGIGNYLPTREQQQEAIGRWNTFWTPTRKTALLTALRQEAAALGYTADAFRPFEEMLTHALSAQPLSYFQPVTDQLTGTYILQDKESCRIINYVKTDREEQLKADINRQGRAFFAFSAKDISHQLIQILNDSFNYIGFVCGFVVFLFLWISFGKIELSLLSFLPLAVSWIWILGIMQLLGIQFNIVNIILATFIFGQGDDYTIFITEGLLYEYTTGRKRLASYKRSVAISALIMFIGMGCLILAKHPALQSLGMVTVIGMFTVVLMAYYLPPLVFRWLTMKNGKRRALPITLQRLAYSLYSLVFFLLLMFLFLIPFTWIYFHIGKTTEQKRLRFHTLLQHIAFFIIRHVPGVRFTCYNASGETFDKPAVIICNHQSHLDLMCLMMLAPKMVFLTNDWAWRNPLYGSVIHKAEFYPVSDGIEKNLPKLRDLYDRGYFICIFPEGTRSEDCNILRFHKGAFYLAHRLHADILPIFLHGAGHVLPKTDFMLNRGCIHVEIDRRIGPQEYEQLSEDDNEMERLMTRQAHRYYLQHYAAICRDLETDSYWAPYRRYADYYKLKQ